MQLLGHRPQRLLAAWAALGVAAAVTPALWMWGFTVDDALISVRYARHLAAGLGWCFNAHGPSTDGVTPLPWPLLLAPFARVDSVVVLERAKWLGLASWSAAAGLLGGAIGRTSAPAWARAAALATLALCVPVAAYAVSGMETALATALATAAVVLGCRLRLACLLAGLAASLRPEMAPWAFVLAMGLEQTSEGSRSPLRSRIARLLVAGTLSLAPFVLCALIRLVAWGRPAPLAVLAKPSDLAHGLAYAGAACVVTLAPILMLAPVVILRDARTRTIFLAAAVHVATVVFVGGDWMPYARLMVPIVPSLVYAAVLAAEVAHPAATALRSAAAIALGVTLVARGGTMGRTVGPDRAALIASARPTLARSTRVAALDVGWVSAATEADIVDLAGLTDPEIAALPGGHTSKRVEAMYLLARAPDVLILYGSQGLPPAGFGAWRELVTPRAVEARLSDDAIIARHFAPSEWLPLGSSGAGYLVLRSR